MLLKHTISIKFFLMQKFFLTINWQTPWCDDQSRISCAVSRNEIVSASSCFYRRFLLLPLYRVEIIGARVRKLGRYFIAIKTCLRKKGNCIYENIVYIKSSLSSFHELKNGVCSFTLQCRVYKTVIRKYYYKRVKKEENMIS